MKRTLKGFGILGGLIACQFGIGMLRPLSVLFYLDVAKPFYDWINSL